MKILVIADEESQKIWDFFRKEDYADIDLVISCGDLKADYLSFIATMIAVPVLYVHGNHDDKYKRKPPEGCICIEDTVYMFHGIRILGLGCRLHWTSESFSEYRTLRMVQSFPKRAAREAIRRSTAPSFPSRPCSLRTKNIGS